MTTAGEAPDEAEAITVEFERFDHVHAAALVPLGDIGVVASYPYGGEFVDVRVIEWDGRSPVVRQAYRA